MTDPAPTTDPVTPPAPVPTPPVAPPPPAPAPPAEDPAAQIARLEADLKSARAEAGKERVTAKTKAADDARAELAQTIGKALGLVADDTPVDPAKLTEQLTATSAQAKTLATELAVFKAADAAGGDASKLLDSRAFLDSLSGVDTADVAALTAAITKAVTDHPHLAKAGTPVLPRMQPNPAQGGSANPPLGLQQQIAAAEAGGNLREIMRLKAQLATSL